MITVMRPAASAAGETGIRHERVVIAPGDPIPADAIWIDLMLPTRQEDATVEARLGVSVPTREEMEDIEPSEVLYSEDGALFMTARLLHKANSDDPEITGVTFILKGDTLVTVRYADPYAFTMFANRAAKSNGCGKAAEEVLAGLFDAVIDRAADVLQDAGTQIDLAARSVFDNRSRKQGKRDYQRTLRKLGMLGDLISKQRESLVSIERVLLFLTVAYRSTRVSLELREQVRTALRDLQSLEEHATFQTGKIQFQLEAVLGLVSIEQNDIIKLFSVVAVIFMPPTLIASIYGMNFTNLPEVKWEYGYPMALGMMVLAAILPLVFFRWKKWL